MRALLETILISGKFSNVAESDNQDPLIILIIYTDKHLIST